jgi:hypothetical protein
MTFSIKIEGSWWFNELVSWITQQLIQEKIIDHHLLVLSSFDLSVKDEDCDLPLLYWISK